MTWPLKPAEKGKIAVAEGRGGPIQISYEIHGTGPMKLVVSLQIPLTVSILYRESAIVLCRIFKTCLMFLSDVDMIFSGLWA